MPKKTHARVLASLLAGGALLVAAVPAASAWDGPVTDGRPNLTESSPAGYYLWHDDDGFHLRTHGPGSEHDFVARLHTGGTFEDVDPVRLESGDGIAVEERGHELVLRFHTFDATDGVNFRIEGGERLRLRLDLDGRPIPTDRVFLGEDGAHPRSNPFTLER